MYRILRKKVLNPTVTLMDIDAPLVAKKAEPDVYKRQILIFATNTIKMTTINNKTTINPNANPAGIRIPS